MKNEMTVNDWLFLGELVIDWNATRALRRTGIYTGAHIWQEAARRFNKPAVQAEIQRVQAEIRGRVELNIQLVTQDIVNVLSADPRELVELITLACRHCHGVEHRYQRTIGEYRVDMSKAQISGQPFSEMGGYGFDPHLGPADDCPECFGKGVVEERLKDTRFLSPAAAALYMGAKRGKHGIEVGMRSKDAARQQAALFLGMNKETLKVLSKDMKDMTDEELLLMAKGDAP